MSVIFQGRVRILPRILVSLSLSNGMVVCVLPKVGVVRGWIVTARGNESDRDFREKMAVFTENMPIPAISVKKHKSRNSLVISQEWRLFIGTISRHLPLEIAVSGGGEGNWTPVLRWHCANFYMLVLSLMLIVTPRVDRQTSLWLFCLKSHWMTTNNHFSQDADDVCSPLAPVREETSLQLRQRVRTLRSQL